jgi:hypothetical protein
MNGESRSEPLSIEVLLKKQKEEKEAASKVRSGFPISSAMVLILTFHPSFSHSCRFDTSPNS